MDKRRYPPDWDQISLRIRARDGWRCKWCGVPNGAVGFRDRAGTFHTSDQEPGRETTEFREGRIPGTSELVRVIRIVLTVAHLGTAHADGTPGDKHDKLDCRDENLAALCQRCHLNYDRDEHAQNARATYARKRAARIAATGQQELPL